MLAMLMMLPGAAGVGDPYRPFGVESEPVRGAAAPELGPAVHPQQRPLPHGHHQQGAVREPARSAPGSPATRAAASGRIWGHPSGPQAWLRPFHCSCSIFEDTDFYRYYGWRIRVWDGKTAWVYLPWFGWS